MKLSIIVPAYNAGKYIGNCIESIEGSSLSKEDFEIVVVNDGSTDNTDDCVLGKMLEYKNIILVETNDEGVSVARNRGLERAEGEYVAFVDADDVVKPDMFGKLLKVSEEADADITGCGFYCFSTNKETADAVTSNNSKETVDGVSLGNAPEYTTYSPDDFIQKEIIDNHNSRCWSKIYRRSTLSALRFREGLTIGEDMLFLTQAVKASRNIAELKDYKGYGYYQNATGAMNRPFNPRYMDQILCWDLEAEETGLPLIIQRLMSVMLVVAKIALLPKSKWQENEEYLYICHEKLNELIEKYPEGISMLDRGYRIKCKLFKKNPKLYLRFYNFWKR